MGFFNTGEMPQSEPAGASNVSPVNPGITADVDVGLGNVSLPSVDAEVSVGDINLPSVGANVSLLAGDCDGSGLVHVGNSDGGLDINVVDTNGDGLQIDVVTPDSLLDVHAPGLLDLTVGGGNPDCLPDGHAIEVEALNGEHLLEVHAPGLLDVTIGGAELGQILGSDCGPNGSDGNGIQVEVLNGEHVAEAHVPGVANVTIGSADAGGLLHGIDDIAGC